MFALGGGEEGGGGWLSGGGAVCVGDSGALRRALRGGWLRGCRGGVVCVL
jgi:hypothetical protein